MMKAERFYAGASAQGVPLTGGSQDDPYRYQQGFGNRHASEALYVGIVVTLKHLLISDLTVLASYRKHAMLLNGSNMTCTPNRCV